MTTPKIHIRNNTLKIVQLPHGVTLKAGVLDGVNFTAGVTPVDVKVWEEIKKHKMVQAHLDENHFEEHKPTAAEKKADANVAPEPTPTEKAKADEIKRAEAAAEKKK